MSLLSSLTQTSTEENTPFVEYSHANSFPNFKNPFSEKIPLSTLVTDAPFGSPINEEVPS